MNTGQALQGSGRDARSTLRLLAEEARRRKAATTRVSGKGIPRTRPSDKDIVRRLKMCGRADYWLPCADSYTQLRADIRGSEGHWPQRCKQRKNQPARRNNAKRGKYLCDAYEVCTYCWQRRAEMAGMEAVIRHWGRTALHVSMTLPEVRDDLDLAQEARYAFRDAVVSMGFDNYQLYLHQFGDHPSTVKYHIDGVISAKKGKGVPLESGTPPQRIAEALAPYFTRQHQRIHARPQSNTVQSLANAGRYAGRCTVMARRLFAGLYLDKYGRQCYRVVTVKRTGKKGKPPIIEDALAEGPNPGEKIVRDLTPLDVNTMLENALHFREQSMPLKSRRGWSHAGVTAFLDGYKKNVRFCYQLPSEEQLRERAY